MVEQYLLRPPTATSGAQGLAARAVTAVSRAARTSGSRRSDGGGIGGGPAGLPFAAPARVKSTFGRSGTTTLLPAFSGAPPAIHWWRMSSGSFAILGELGGMNGSAVCAMTL